MALCDGPQFYDDRRDLLLNPSLIGEVLSSSTEGYDRGDQFNLYRRIPSLRESLLVAQHRVRVEL
jgi:Uma2 family endonuclease